MRDLFKNNIIIISSLIIFLILALIIIVFQNNPQLTNSYIASFTIVLAIATGFLALFSWLSIRQNIERENRDRRERLLNEIIEWAESVYKCGLNPFSPPTEREAKDKEGMKIYLYDILANMLLEYDSIYLKTDYIFRVSLTLGNVLKIAVDNLAKIVQGRIKLMERQIDILSGNANDNNESNKPVKTDIIKKWISSIEWPIGLDENFKLNMYFILMNRSGLVDNARQVIEEATSLKIRDIV